MGDPMAIVPYHDPFDDINTLEQILMSDENPSLSLTEFSSFQQPISCNPLIPQSSDEEIVDADDPLIDPFLRDLCSHEAGPSRMQEETNGQEREGRSDYTYNTQGYQNMGSPIQLSMWPLPAMPYTCTCCQVLREITHTNGIEITKLEIHGRLGIICHAILDKFSADFSQAHEYQMFDFCKESISSVKQFLVQYCEERKQNGYIIMIQDPLLVFYEALCVGLDWNWNYSDMDTNNFASGDQCRMNQQAEAMTQQEVEIDDTIRFTRSSLAVQRERTSKLKLKDFAEYLHLPITEAAKKMDVCLTVLKKICRRHGLTRWPYRKIKSIRRKILKARESWNGGDVEERMRAEAEIQRLQEKLANIYAVFSDP
ncbi:hypothetical protein LguiA_017912 [Lonicera macranthoides]